MRKCACECGGGLGRNRGSLELVHSLMSGLISDPEIMAGAEIRS